jgi:hypothetical protein
LARIARLSDRFLRARARLGISPGSERGRAVARTIRTLLDADELPGHGDVVAAIPPTGMALVRRVPNRNLWIWYRVEGSTVVLRHISSEPPVPVDE